MLAGGPWQRTARASRLPFYLTIPYLWHDVDINNILELAPGDSQEPETFEGHQIDVLQAFSENYFDRLNLYAPHVAGLDFSWTWYGHKDYSPPEPAWPAAAFHTANRALLPNLKALSLDIEGGSSRNLSIALYWIDVLVSPGKNLVYCSFDLQLEHISPSVKQKARDTLRTTLSPSGGLAYLSLQSSGLWDTDNPFDLHHSSIQALTYLSIKLELLEVSFLTWISRMPELDTLHIWLPGLTERDMVDSSSAIFPPDSFQALRCLEVTTASLTATLYLWRAPIVNHLTTA
ncbi:hypothetical protein FRC10_003287, partial [Ceratobasidium sp. 414]